MDSLTDSDRGMLLIIGKLNDEGKNAAIGAVEGSQKRVPLLPERARESTKTAT